MKTINYAIVGVGYFGAELGRIMKEQEGARVVAVLDPDLPFYRDGWRHYVWPSGKAASSLAAQHYEK